MVPRFFNTLILDWHDQSMSLLVMMIQKWLLEIKYLLLIRKDFRVPPCMAEIKHFHPIFILCDCAYRVIVYLWGGGENGAGCLKIAR